MWLARHAAVAAVALDPAPGPGGRPCMAGGSHSRPGRTEQAAPPAPVARRARRPLGRAPGAPIRVGGDGHGSRAGAAAPADSITWWAPAQTIRAGDPRLVARAPRRRHSVAGLVAARGAGSGAAERRVWRVEHGRRLLLWAARGRRAAVAHSRRSPTIDPPVPVLADGALWWVAYGYVTSATFPLAHAVAFEGPTVRYRCTPGFVGAVAGAPAARASRWHRVTNSLSAAWARRFSRSSSRSTACASLRAPPAVSQGVPSASRRPLLLNRAPEVQRGLDPARRPTPFEITAPDPVGAAPGARTCGWAQGIRDDEVGEFAGAARGRG